MSSSPYNIGTEGEEAAARWLRREGFEILHRNWRAGRYELDIVARHGPTIHFVEVKTRRAGGLTSPEEALTPAKAAALQHAAALYLSAQSVSLEPQFDLAAVDALPDGTFAVRYIPRALECRW